MLTKTLSLALALAASVDGPAPPGEFAPHTSLRLLIEPSDADVYVSGQLVGQVADFDGLFQRLTVKPGEREVILYREGYRTVRQTLDLRPGAEQKIRYVMELLGEGETPEPPPAPVAAEPPGVAAGNVPERAAAAEALRERGARPATGFGVIEINVKPRPDTVLIDGERWPFGRGEDGPLVFHLGAGQRRIEVRRSGYETFRTEVLVKDGEPVELNVSLPRQ